MHLTVSRWEQLERFSVCEICFLESGLYYELHNLVFKFIFSVMYLYTF